MNYLLNVIQFAAIPIIYQENRGWNTLVATLPFIALLLGSFTAAGINVLVSKSHIRRDVRLAYAVHMQYSEKVFSKRMLKHGSVEPEWRLPPMMVRPYQPSFPDSMWRLNSCLAWFRLFPHRVGSNNAARTG